MLEISNKFFTKFNIFNHMILHLRFKRVWEIFKTRLYDLKHSGWVVLLEMLQLVPQKLGMKLLEMGKDVKIKHSVSSAPYKLCRNFFRKKVWHEGTNFFGQVYVGMFYMGTNDQIMQGEKLIVKRFQRPSQVSFRLIHPGLGYRYII